MGIAIIITGILTVWVVGALFFIFPDSDSGFLGMPLKEAALWPKLVIERLRKEIK